MICEHWQQDDARDESRLQGGCPATFPLVCRFRTCATTAAAFHIYHAPTTACCLPYLDSKHARERSPRSHVRLSMDLLRTSHMCHRATSGQHACFRGVGHGSLTLFPLSSRTLRSFLSCRKACRASCWRARMAARTPSPMRRARWALSEPTPICCHFSVCPPHLLCPQLFIARWRCLIGQGEP